MLPAIWDTTVFVLYVINGFGSAFEFFETEEFTPWAYYAIAVFAYALLEVVYNIVMIAICISDMFFESY